MKFHLPPRDIIQDENVTYLFGLYVDHANTSYPNGYMD